MSNYDDPRWYEDPRRFDAQHPDSTTPRQSAYDDFDPLSFLADNTNAHTQQPQYRVPSSPSHHAEYSFRRGLRRFFGLAVLVIAAFLAGWFGHQLFTNTFTLSSQSQSYSQLVQEAWTTIDQNYVDRKAVNYQKMSYAAIQSMVNTLNDNGHTRFMTPGEVQSENQQLSGKFTGIGIYLHQDTKTKQLIVTAPIPGSPAEKAGMKSKDVLIAINGVSTQGKDVNGVSTMIQGKAGTNVDITVQRPGVATPIIFHIVRAVIQVPNVIMHYIKEDHTADIQIVQFADGISSQVRDAVNQAKSMGATHIILDLRDNPGGYLQEAINTSSLFVKSGNVLLEQDSSQHRTPVPVNGNPIDTSTQIVVLINGNTASAAEIVSGALRDNNRAILIGAQSYGTGTVLQQFTLSDGSAILLGTQEWLTPKGDFIRQTKIQPTIKVVQPNNGTTLTPAQENAEHMTEQQILNGGDTQLDAAIKYLESH